MTTESYVNSPANLAVFREKVVAALRLTGRQQRELAGTLGIDAQVLSRKLHGAKRSFPTHVEVKKIIKSLATWDAITTQVEALELLSLMGLRAESFSEQEWNTAPLNKLEPAAQYATPVQSASTPLPVPSTPLIGREGHVQMLLDRLRQPTVRLLTLLGTGGVGKTRLALEAARAACPDFADGVYFVSLATIRDAVLVPSTIVQALHLSEPLARDDPGRQGVSSREDLLKGFLRDKTLLLVLDNVEQIPHIVPFFSDLLSSSASLKIMVTSRSVLHLYGEHEFNVPPLEVCAPDYLPNVNYVSQFASVRLFVERAQAVNPTFQITEHNAATIAQICARLDGLPLAIELAAVRTKVLPLPAILQRLAGGTGQSLTFLRSTSHNFLQRHQTLLDTLDWSYELLNPRQQRLFRRLSVFLGGWTLHAAQTVGMPEDGDSLATLDDALDLIASLIDHSLVKQIQLETGSRDGDAEPRFYFLETIREYALVRLETSEEREDVEDIHRRHAIYYLAFAERIEPALFGREQFLAASMLAREQDNLREALAWAVEHNEAAIAQRMCGTLGMFWEARTQFQEAHRWIDVALTMTGETSPTVRAKLLIAASRLALWETACQRSRQLAENALALYESVGDTVGRTLAIFQIGGSWLMQGEYDQASMFLEESLPLLHEQENWRTYAVTLSRLGAMAILQGNFSQAWTRLHEALPLLREYSEPGLLNVTLVYLGVLALVQGDLKQSASYLREGLLLARQTGNRYTLASNLIAFGCLLGIIQAPSYAARVCSAAEALFAILNIALPAAYGPLYNTFLGNIKSQVDETTWETWWAEGKTLSQEELCTLALEASNDLSSFPR
ncbi:MAG TPA: NB-ARC domain-containing protein [Ktedonobacteraceae bacterium]|nr:NB-ARC domain-containing protein [Ktedonobacteraceae bacterium]